MADPVIAIDGPAASGKGTLARGLAEKLNFAYMDTGALYRAVAYEVLRNGFSLHDKKDAISAAQILAKKLKASDDPGEVLGLKTLREDRVGVAASKVAAMPEVRQALLEAQRDFAADPGRAFKGAILDGRDIGTVICPNAPLKLFVTATLEVRATRRLKELQSRGIKSTYEAVLKDMRERDARDTGRNMAPLKPADDAITIDSSDLTAAEMLEKALGLAQDRLAV